MLENIVTIDSTHEDFQKVKLNSAYLGSLIEAHRPALVIFDPLQSFLPPPGRHVGAKSDAGSAGKATRLWHDLRHNISDRHAHEQAAEGMGPNTTCR